MPSPFSFLTNSFKRKKILESDQTSTQLNRCLTTFDLTTIGVGSTIGSGIYVLSGQVASSTAGSAIILSYLIAGIASLFAALCYAEFGSLVPKAGSAYIYSYITVGELMAFVIGWNLVLENMIGSAALARAYSGYIDSLVSEGGWSFTAFFREHMPMNVPYLSTEVDFLAYGIMVFVSLLMCFGVRTSTNLNSIFTILNLMVVVSIIIAGSFKINTHNWALSYDEVPHEIKTPENPKPKDGGVGGFFPFGLNGMIAGAATCFYAFIGFDHICSTGEEAKNPRKSVPRAVALALIIVFLCYTGVATVQTLIWPYYDQNVSAPFAYIFTKLNWPVAKWAVSVGALLALSTTLIGVLFALPRIFYAMASDGLIYRFLGKVHPKTKCPVIATILSGFVAGAISALFDVKQLAEMLSIGVLLAYTLVAISVLLLRYSPAQNTESQTLSDPSTDFYPYPLTVKDIIIRLFNTNNQQTPTLLTKKMSIGLLGMSTILVIIIDALAIFAQKYLAQGDIYAAIGLGVSLSCFVFCLIALSRQPQSTGRDSFKVPLVPFVPFASIIVNICLMMNLPIPTWIRFGVWMIIGFFIYFTYGISNSTGFMSTREKDDYMTRKGIKRQEVVLSGH